MTQESRTDELKGALLTRIHPLDKRLRGAATERVAIRALSLFDGALGDTVQLVGALVRSLSSMGDAIRAEEETLAALVASVQTARTSKAQRRVLKDFLERHATSKKDLAEDLRALDRWLDLESISERFTARIADLVDEVDVAAQCLARFAEESSGARRVASEATTIATLRAHAAEDRKSPQRTAALKALARIVALADEEHRLTLVGLSLYADLERWAAGTMAPRWVQIAAMRALTLVDGERGRKALVASLEARRGKDRMVVRANALKIATTTEVRARGELFAMAADDPSEHVRQELARCLAATKTRDALASLVALVRDDASERVAGVALRELSRLAVDHRPARASLKRALRIALTDATRALRVKVALDALPRVCGWERPIVAATDVLAPLEALARGDGASYELAERAAATLRWLEVDGSERLRAVRDVLEKALSALFEGESARVELPAGTTAREGELALLVASRGDMACALTRRRDGSLVLTRGEPRVVRLWKAIVETGTLAPDKRKGYAHVKARRRAGDTLVPPIGMAEVTATRVPGERVLQPEVGWGPFLPRLDDVLSVCTVRGKPLRIVTTMGTVHVRPPEALASRAKAWWTVTRRYRDMALARDRSLQGKDATSRREYADMVRRLGVTFTLDEREGVVDETRFVIDDARPLQFLGAAVLLVMLPRWVEHTTAYLVSPVGSSPGQLAVTATLIFLAFVLRSAWTMQGIELARKALPLSIGGWGTRGKSGSERVKAALFHALRYDVLVKTTGCEAMFVHAQRDLPAQEIFIYRPYDKATVWEQRDVLYVARDLHAQVFLWECMALQPKFVQMLQNEWVQDPITTLTNAYPDHEDIQGPGGEDVARVIATFNPIKGTVLTTEEQMLPLIADGAKRNGSKLIAIPPLEADLLPQDLLDRLPYQEHPRNIALVLALAELLGVDRELALVEIADHVLLDLGVLKTYPETEHRGRTMVFSNGMSANERAGFMSNWTRLGFHTMSVDDEPTVSSVAVINNRADRVARSRVFAGLLVNDASLDAVVLINTNLGGMVQFIGEELDKRLAGETLGSEGGAEGALAQFDKVMAHLKVPLDATWPAKLTAMLSVLGLDEAAVRAIVDDDAVRKAFLEGAAVREALAGALERHGAKGHELAEDVLEHAAKNAKRMARRRVARGEVEAALRGGNQAGADAAMRSAYRELFLDRVHVLWDAGAKGDQVIDFTARQGAPGHKLRVLGAQNIKGTGLDFVYRWLAVDRAAQWIERMEDEPHARGEVLATLGSTTDWSMLDVRLVRRWAERTHAAALPEWAPHQETLARLVEHLGATEAKKVAALSAVGQASRAAKVLAKLEAFVDHMDSVRRTSMARRVMRDLFAKRVSHGRAAILLRDITGRGKGGWLAKDLEAWRAARRLRASEDDPST